jgi:hypothetical protein
LPQQFTAEGAKDAEESFGRSPSNPLPPFDAPLPFV